MPDPIPPALTASEWGRIHPLPRVVGGAPRVAIACGLREPGVPGEKALSFDPATEPHALMAALNATLADDDPGKLTRAMVDDLRIAQHEARKAVGVDCMNGPCDECKAACERFCARLEQYARAVAALLPPERP